MLYDDFITTCHDAEIAEIVRGVKHDYNKSANMPWVSADGFAQYFAWLKTVCDEKSIEINGVITQLKNAYVSTVFCVPTSMSNLYMKIPGKVFINELPFTHKLKEFGIVDLPNWIDYNLDMNVFLMKDMGGNDLPHQSDICTLKKVILQLAEIQKASISHIPLDFEHYDYSIVSHINKLNTFAEETCKMLKGTPHELSESDKNKLAEQLTIAKSLLEIGNNTTIPNVIHHGDIRQGNIRVIDKQYMFYDWALSSVSHPFIEIVSFLHIIRRTLPNESDKDMLADFYLNEWLDYGTHDELKQIYSSLAVLRDLFFAIVDYDWVLAVKQSCDNPINIMSADGWLFERRLYYFANVLKRFISTSLAT
ncbi:MAG: aminoglycoside phosphotransferase family protein [Defluviitaleaceae bacterium]|nr:aminoglycoside phosphotransferase family protein [Defluviitaleaceae bacterium]